MATSWNDQIIAEFRANAGKVGGRFEGRALLLLHHTGARTGIARLCPLSYQDVNGSLAVFASKGGAPTNPHWYHNLRANREAWVEVGTESFDVIAREALGEERDRIWTRQKELVPVFAEYEAKTTRRIPVMVLERVGSHTG